MSSSLTSFLMKKSKIVFCAALFPVIFYLFFWDRSGSKQADILLATAKERSFVVEVHSCGEIDAGQSTMVSSSLRGDMAKLIELIPDGTPVKRGDVIARIDATPFEEKIQDILLKIQDQKLKVKGLSQAYQREKSQVGYEQECVQFEVESCELELDRIKNGEGPFEISRLNSALTKAKSKYEELLNYQKELEGLILGSEFPPGELVQCEKQIEQEKEAYLLAKKQYENYVQFVYPSAVKKAEVSLRKAISKQKEAQNIGTYRVASAKIALDQAIQYLEVLKRQRHAGENELLQTTISSPSPGIIVHRLEFRAGSKRKPQLGDMLMKNQPLLEIPDLSSMIVRTKIREMDLHKVEVGKSATIEVDAFPGKAFSGEVVYLGTLAKREHANGYREKAFEMTVRLTEKDSRLRPGMTARVTIHSDTVKDKLTIPSHAVFLSDNKYLCYCVTLKGYEKKEVKISPGNDQWIVVAEGLTKGDTVLLTPPMD